MSKLSKILVVEDSAFFRRAISEGLTREGYAVTAVASGEDALQHIRADKPNLVLLDMHLPRLDGMMVLRILRSAPETKELPVIVLSGNAMERDRAAAEKLGVSDYIQKDRLPMEQLVLSIRAILGMAA
jgi:CheY-like chemotaxis protein